MKWIGCVLLVLLIGAAWSQEQNLEDRMREEYGSEPEEVVIKMEDLEDWIGKDPEEERRNERHAVGMCWQSEMARCVNSCTNSTSSFEILQEICASYCQADVTWVCTKMNLDYGGTEIFKFSGRWPFSRVWIFTEFGSVLFCSFSVFMHVFWLWEYLQKTDPARVARTPNLPAQEYPYRWLWIVTHIIWMITFSCATLFHTVDIRLTEYLDYFTAMLSTLYGIYSFSIRIFEVRRPSTMYLMVTPLLGYYLFHIVRMVAIRFSYGYNMRATIGMIVIQSIISGLWSLRQWQLGRTHVKWLLMGQLALFVFCSLEVFDYPPFLGWFDTHAIWHLSINVIFFFWNRFYIKDTLYYRPTSQSKSD